MITPAWVRMLCAYNAEMNRRLYEAAGRLDDAGRKRDRGAFFGSIHATLNHLVWADLTWMSRFDGWEKPGVGIREGLRLHDDFSALAAARAETDARLSGWAGRLDAAWLDGELTWFSGAAQREVTRPRAVLVSHMINHQTHHRGQVHAMLTAAGERTGDTDLFVVVQS
jgi:uncharacterized damage-inducible protein DinB